MPREYGSGAMPNSCATVGVASMLRYVLLIAPLEIRPFCDHECRCLIRCLKAVSKEADFPVRILTVVGRQDDCPLFRRVLVFPVGYGFP